MRQSDWKKKILTINQASKIVKKNKKKGLVTGLATGCFDIIHRGHIDLFHFAKKHVDILIVGLDNDESIRLSKGNNRPVNSLKERMKVLAELTSVDYVFPFEKTFNHSLENARFYEEILRKISPNYLITNPLADINLWRKKKELAKRIGIGFLKDNRKKLTSTSKIIEKLLKK